MKTYDPILTHVRAWLPGTSRTERADFVEDLVRTVYDHVKLRDPEGDGLDGRDGPERTELGHVVAAAIEHAQAQSQRDRGSSGL